MKDELEDLIATNINDTPPGDDSAVNQKHSKEKLGDRSEETKEKRAEAKAKREEAKKRRDAQLATSNDAAKRILALQPCTKCDELTDQRKILGDKLKERERQLQEKEKHINELESKNSDLLSSVTAKRSRIADLELQVKRTCTQSGGNKFIYTYVVVI